MWHIIVVSRHNLKKINNDSGSYYINRVGSANGTFEKTWNCVATDSFNSSVLFFVFCCYCVVVFVFVVVCLF